MAHTTRAHEAAAGITVAALREKLAGDSRWAMRALVVLYECQTPQEKELEVTAYHNGYGFSACDAEILTSFAKQLSWRPSLTAPQMEVLHDRIVRYAGQIVRLMAAKKQVEGTKVEQEEVAA